MDENTFMGPKVNKAEIEKISQMVDLSLQQGGKILLDMTPEKKPTENGNWLYPCIVEVEDNKMNLFRMKCLVLFFLL